MNITNDIEYLELLEQMIEKKEREYGVGWARSWGAIRNQNTNSYNHHYNLMGREVVIEHLKYHLNK